MRVTVWACSHQAEKRCDHGRTFPHFFQKQDDQRWFCTGSGVMCCWCDENDEYERRFAESGGHI